MNIKVAVCISLYVFVLCQKKNDGFRVIDHRISKYHLMHRCDNFVTTHKILMANISINILQSKIHMRLVLIVDY